MQILSVMFYPEDAQSRDLFLALNKFDALKSPAHFPRFSYDFLKALRNAPNREESDRVEAARLERGLIAGDILMLLAVMAQHFPRDASLNKAYFVLRKIDAGSNLPKNKVRSPRMIEKCWQEFKNVSHLWGATHMWAQFVQNKTPLTASESEPAMPLLGFLAQAEALREFGERHYAPLGPSGSGRSSRPLLDPSETWTAPAQLRLPKIEPSMQPSFIPQIANALREYSVET